jgi:predicted acylesterase/phospholipase RssA
MSEIEERAHSYLKGESLSFKEADELWRKLKHEDHIALARAVLQQIREGDGLLDVIPDEPGLLDKLCQQEALLTSKDPELSSVIRHDSALKVLRRRFSLSDKRLDGDAETLGIAGGIYKRRWAELGDHEDLLRASECYTRGAGDDLGADAYTHINAAFVDDLLASTGDNPDERRSRAAGLRQRIVAGLSKSEEWFNVASRAEALFGLKQYAKATEVIGEAVEKPALWQLETTAKQLATLAYLQDDDPLADPKVREFFDALLPGAVDAVRSAFVGKVGLALSGGGFRASFYHLGVLARLAELDVLRHVDVLSCVSGGSIVGACYWMVLRQRLLEPEPMGHQDYIDVVRKLISHFEQAVGRNLRGQIQPWKATVIYRLLVGSQKGAMDPQATADALAEHFYGPLGDPEFMDELPFNPADHDAALTGSEEFHTGKHNWLRAHKVPALVLNATTVNTGHSWQFTPTWMGESPWAVNDSNSTPRLEWSWYQPNGSWRMPIAKAVAASAAVPGVFAPLEIDDAYPGIKVQLVDGGVHDNQGTVALLAMNCNVLLVSDAAGQLLLETGPQPGVKGLGSYAVRSMDTLMERVRQANYGDLAARCRSGLLRGLMFLHMKAGLDADTVRLKFSQETFAVRRTQLSPSGVRKDFQKAIAELRTDLDAFTPDESRALMACGYQMARKTYQKDLGQITELAAAQPIKANWPFAELLAELTSTRSVTPRRGELLEALEKGSEVQI